MAINKLWALVQFRLGFHALPIEQGRFARPALLRHFCRCTVCDTQAVGAELQCVLDCPHFSDTRAQFPGLFQDAAGCMCVSMWHNDQKSVCRCLIALLQKAQSCKQSLSLKAGWPNGRSESLSGTRKPFVIAI